MKSIQPFIQRKIVVLHDDSTIEQAARAMQAHQIGCVMVSNHKGQIVGIVTDRDLVNRVFAAKSKSNFDDEIIVRDIMTKNPLAIDEMADLNQVIKLMEENGIRRVPIIHKTTAQMEICVGIITLDDLIASKSIDLHRLSRIIRSQIRRKMWLANGRSDLTNEKETELTKFYEIINSKIKLQFELSQPDIEQLTIVVLGILIQRLHYTGAMHLIYLLPYILQMKVIDLVPGPNTHMTLEKLIQDTCQLFNANHPTAFAMIALFCIGFKEWCQTQQFNEIDHIKAQLPSDLKSLFEIPGYEFLTQTKKVV